MEGPPILKVIVGLLLRSCEGQEITKKVLRSRGNMSLWREQNNGKWLFWLAGWTGAVRGLNVPDGVPIERTEQRQMAVLASWLDRGC